MKYVLSKLAIAAFALYSSVNLAAPLYLITHNKTNLESNAYVGDLPSPHPSKPGDNKVLWMAVKMICHNHTTNGNWCPAVIKMATNTANPIELGSVVMNLDTGEIVPNELHANGYALYVNGPGETTLMKD